VSIGFKKFDSDADMQDVGLMFVLLELLHSYIRCTSLESSQDHLELTPYDAQRSFSPFCLWANNRKHRNEGMVLLSVNPSGLYAF
jgi:hypothetical protein